MISADLRALWPALCDVVGFAGIPLFVIADQGRGFERWFTNEPAATLLGYPLDELSGIPPIDTIWQSDRALLTQLSTQFRGGQPIPPTLEFSCIHKDGHQIRCDVSISGVKITGGVAYVMTLRDIDALASSQLTQLSMLESDRIGLVGALAAGFAHEINNPLTYVLLNLRSLRKQLVTQLPEAAQALALRCHDDITTGTERIASTVRAFQSLAARGESQQVDLAALVSSSLRLAAPSLGPRANVIRQIFPVPAVYGEEARLGQAVLAMFLFSSSGFDPEPPRGSSNRIVVEVAERGGDVIVEVTDNGSELSAEEARRAFDPFFRSKARGAGVGVGLGVARAVAATHGGEVSLAPRPGGGAIITMRLPVPMGT